MNPIHEFESLCAKLEATTKRKEKEALLSECLPKNPEVAQLFKYALDPYVMFFVNIPEAGHDNMPTYEAMVSLLDRLSKREITGTAAKELAHTLAGPKYLRRLINKNLKIGVQEATVNKIIPKLIPSFELMLAEPIKMDKGQTWEHLIHYLEDHKEWFIQPKYDGWRCIIIIRDGKVFIYSRSGKPMYNTQFVEAAVKQLFPSNVVLDGELLWILEDGTMSFKETSRVLGTDVSTVPEADIQRLKFCVFDMIPLEEWDSQNFSMPFSKRSANVREYFRRATPESLPPFVDVDQQTPEYRRQLISLCDDRTALQFLREAPTQRLDLSTEDQIKQHVLDGFEGSILRYGLKAYELKRSKWTLKWKQFFDCNLTVVGSYEGKDRNLGRLGGLSCRGEFIQRPGSDLGYEIKPDLGQPIAPENMVTADVGGGFKDAQRVEFWATREQLVGKVIEVKYQELSKDDTGVGWSLRFNPFRRFRDDLQ